MDIRDSLQKKIDAFYLSAVEPIDEHENSSTYICFIEVDGVVYEVLIGEYYDLFKTSRFLLSWKKA